MVLLLLDVFIHSNVSLTACVCLNILHKIYVLKSKLQVMFIMAFALQWYARIVKLLCQVLFYIANKILFSTGAWHPYLL